MLKKHGSPETAGRSQRAPRPQTSAGFTLVETIIALLMSSLVIILVSTTFLVQNQYYSSQIDRSALHDNARVATDLLAAELRSVMADGITVAGARTLTIRTPMVTAGVCDVGGNHAMVYTSGGEAALDTDEIAGVALRDTTTGAWTYANAPWDDLNGGDGNAAEDCYDDGGADTVGFMGDFHRINDLNDLGVLPVLGDVIMLFRETTYTIRTSVMDASTLGFFRQAYGESAIEFATGLSSTAQFQYRTAAGTYQDTVTTADLSKIDVVRVVADAERKASTGGVDDLTFGWSVNIALRNLRDSGS